MKNPVPFTMSAAAHNDITVGVQNLEIKQPDSAENDALQAKADPEGGAEQEELLLEPKKKKKRSKKRKSKPTGFEENYAEAPVTPAEYKEDQNQRYRLLVPQGMKERDKLTAYARDLPFSTRIETCVQRYRATRTMSSERADVFTQYLRLGGIDTSPKKFTGGVDFNDDTLDSDDIMARTATDYVGADKANIGRDTSLWQVDFEGVAQGFFSEHAPDRWDLTDDMPLSTVTGVVRNFLRYVQYHAVCPEYDDQVKAALRVCDQADHEISFTATAPDLFPGQFGEACSVLFRDKYKFSGNEDLRFNTSQLSMSDMDPERARMVYSVGVSFMAQETQFKQVVEQKEPESVQIEEGWVEITAIIPPTTHETKLYTNVAADIKCLGRLRAKTWTEPYPTPEDTAVGESLPSKPVHSHEFWIEPELLNRCVMGMKIYAAVGCLPSGISFIDNVTNVLASFYTVLTNSFLDGWAEPKAWDKGFEEEGAAKAEEAETDGEEDEKVSSKPAVWKPDGARKMLDDFEEEGEMRTW